MWLRRYWVCLIKKMKITVSHVAATRDSGYAVHVDESVINLIRCCGFKPQSRPDIGAKRRFQASGPSKRLCYKLYPLLWIPTGPFVPPPPPCLPTHALLAPRSQPPPLDLMAIPPRYPGEENTSRTKWSRSSLGHFQSVWGLLVRKRPPVSSKWL